MVYCVIRSILKQIVNYYFVPKKGKFKLILENGYKKIFITFFKDNSKIYEINSEKLVRFYTNYALKPTLKVFLIDDFIN